MDLTLLSAALRESLLQSKSVVLPGIGTFTITEVPPVFLNGGKTLTPPAQEIAFSATHMKNDGELEAVFTRLAELSPEEGKVKMALLIEKIRTSIHTNRLALIPEFGILAQDPNFQFHFTPDKSFCFCPDYYLLEPLSLKPEEGETEIFPELATADIPVFLDENPLEKDVWVIKDGEPQPEEESVDSTIAQPVPPEENTSVAQMPFPAEHALIPENPLAPEHPVTPQIPLTPENSVPELATPDADTTLTPATATISSGQSATAATPPTPSVPTRKWLWITLITLGTLLLACVLIYLFRAELSPILEKLLYTPEELDVLRRTGR